jgi:3-hydroxyisobutyrate dehydrogenase-like beta-hydroxyacid dehydrogenase
MSSSEPSDTLRLAADLAPDGVRVVDAPVSGGVPRAVTGKLSVMVGGDDADVDGAQPVLRVLGDPARHGSSAPAGSAPGTMAKDVHIARSVAAAAETDAPVIALADERWAKALGQFGPAADQSAAHQAWWDDRFGDE